MLDERSDRRRAAQPGGRGRRDDGRSCLPLDHDQTTDWVSKPCRARGAGTRSPSTTAADWRRIAARVPERSTSGRAFAPSDVVRRAGWALPPPAFAQRGRPCATVSSGRRSRCPPARTTSASRQSHGSQTTRRTPINPVTGRAEHRRSDSRVAASRNEKAIVKLAYAIESAMRAQHRLRRDFSRPADSTCLPSLSMLRWERPTGGWQETSSVSGRSGRAPPRARLCRRVCR